MDDVTAAILRQNAHHTPAYWWREHKLELSSATGTGLDEIN